MEGGCWLTMGGSEGQRETTLRLCEILSLYGIRDGCSISVCPSEVRKNVLYLHTNKKHSLIAEPQTTLTQTDTTARRRSTEALIQALRWADDDDGRRGFVCACVHVFVVQSLLLWLLSTRADAHSYCFCFNFPIVVSRNSQLQFFFAHSLAGPGRREHIAAAAQCSIAQCSNSRLSLSLFDTRTRYTRDEREREQSTEKSEFSGASGG